MQAEEEVNLKLRKRTTKLKQLDNISTGYNETSKNQIETSKLWLFVYTNSFSIILLIRILSVWFNLIWDCDETYNYWEPLHFVLFKSGFQTWEYSPEFSLRSYLYIFLHALPIWPFKYVLSKITLFYLLRFVFAIISSKMESDLFQSLRHLTQNSKYSLVAKLFFLFSLTNVGMFLSVTSFLPSTFSMYLTMKAYSAWLHNPLSSSSILSIGLAVLLGWPFAVLVGIPIAIDICFFNKNGFFFLLKWTLIFGCLIAIPLVCFDSFLFGKPVLAPLNIVLYNVFSSSDRGPDIYGREPLSYYLINCFLNFNILSLIACLAPFLVCIDYFIIRKTNPKDQLAFSNNKSFSIICFSVILWILVFFTRPHKEERFLYPIYPLILVLSSVSLNYLKIFLAQISKKYKMKKLLNLLPYFVISIHAVLSIMRILALIKNFSASLQIYNELNKLQVINGESKFQSKAMVNVCVSKEWYRFPSHFFIPENIDPKIRNQKLRLRFLPSDFKGQLPGYFNETASLPDSTRQVDKLFNDLNKEVHQRYIDIKKCDFLIDTDNKNDDTYLFIDKKNTNTKWKTLVKIPFLDVAESNRIFRSFYIPFLYEKRVKHTFFKLRLRIE